ncbi:DUF6789 family protein [Streptosporangium sp. NPDC001559]|uniref:DUF6789 family protein n=1 Tax=Streptosporangium sp. NPDC001559 TaxID=3366187 RepID=UPI0036EB23CA
MNGRGLLEGGVGGALATAAMSAVMLAGSRAGLMADQPPKHIVRAALPGHPHRRKPGEGVLGALAHFGFGMTAGTLFRLVSRGHRTPVPVGIGYGLAIWLASYQGWVPGVTALPPISADRPGRPAVMAVGHVVYGITLAAVLNRFRDRNDR